MRVELSGQRFSFPTRCACCGGHPDTTLTAKHSKTSGTRVVRTKTWSWDFPYCTRCVKHVSAWSSSATYGALVAGICFVTTLSMPNAAAAVAMIVIALIGAVVGTAARRNHIRREMCARTCVAPGAAVAYVHWYGTLHAFEIDSRSFAAAFMALNAKKLVNVTEEGRQLLGSLQPTPSATPH